MSLLSRGIVQLLVAATHDGTSHQTPSFYFKLGQQDSAHVNYDPSIVYTSTNNKQCDADTLVNVAFHDDPAVRDSQCYMKCLVHNGPGCEAYNEYCSDSGKASNAECTSGSNLLCIGDTSVGDTLGYEGLCNSLDDCDSYTMLPDYDLGGSRRRGSALPFKVATLNTASCTSSELSTLNKATLWTKPTAMSLSCPLGSGIEVSNTSIASMSGLYEADQTDLSRGGVINYLHVDNDNFIGWQSCGWTGYLFQGDATPAPTPAPTCPDNDLWANYIFGQCNDLATCETEDPDYEANICQHATTVWGSSYCSNAVFAQICAGSCSASCNADMHGDDSVGQTANSAAGQYAAMIGYTLLNKNKNPKSSLTYCEQLDQGTSQYPSTDETTCNNVIVQAICPVTCAARRLDQNGFHASKKSVMALTKQLRSERRLAVSAVTMSDLKSDLAAGKYTEVFYTHPAQFDGSACTGSETNILPYPFTQVYDVAGWQVPLDTYELSLQCDSKVNFKTTSGSEERFCTLNNIPAAYNTNPEIVNNQCFRKCAHRRSPIYNTTILNSTGLEDGRVVDENDYRYQDLEEDGSATWCSGNSADFTADTDALCLPREECEALCRGTADCKSIDMHRLYPRCYFNTQTDCHADATKYTADSSYDVLIKYTTPSADPTSGDPESSADDERTVYTSVSGKQCSGTAISTTSSTRRECEAGCTAAASCVAYKFTGTCASTTAGKDTIDTAACSSVGTCLTYSDVDATSCTLDYTETWYASGMNYAGLVVHAEKVTPAKCFVDVNNVTFTTAGESTTVDGAEVYLTADHAARLRYRENTAGTFNCPGWVYQDNVAAHVPMTFKNCTDRQTAAADFLADWWLDQRHQEYLTEKQVAEDDAEAAAEALNRTSNYNHTEYVVPAAPDFRFPCQWAQEHGLCDTTTDVGVVMIGLCPHTCVALVSTTLPYLSATFSEQNPDLYGRTDSSCKTSSDNNFAMWKFREALQYSWPETALPGADDEDAACEQITGVAGNWFNHTHSPCHFLGKTTRIVKALCPNSCNVDAPVDPSVVAIPTEIDSAGAQSRRLDDYTVSDGGKASPCQDPNPDPTVACINADGLAEYTMSYRPVNHDVESDWASVATTFLPATQIGSQGSTVDEDGNVNNAAPSCGSSSGNDKYGLLSTTTMYASNMPLVSTVIARVCRSNSVCPMLTTCVLNSLRLDDEMKLFYGNDVSRSSFLSDLDKPTRDPVLAPTNFDAKVLIGEHRATALIDATKAEFANVVHRAVPLATRIKLDSTTDFGDKMIVTLADGNDDAAAVRELGRVYSPSALGTVDGASGAALYSAWRTDVIRIERFNVDGTPDNEGEVTFRLYAPEVEGELVFFMFNTVPGVVPTKSGTVTKLSDGWYSVTLPRANADFVGTEDVDECASSYSPKVCAQAVAGTSTVDAACENRVGQAPVCSCPSPEYSGTGYESDRDDGVCTLASLSYAPENDDYYVRIRHTDRLDYGWRVSQIKLYENTECSGGEVKKTNVAVDFPVQTGVSTYDQLVKNTQVFTGPAGNSHYPHSSDSGVSNGQYEYGGQKLFTSAGEWRSACLNCNPDEVDMTHGGAAEIMFLVSGENNIGCIEITQASGHPQSKSIRIERGPVSQTGCGVDVDYSAGHVRTPLCKPTMTWTQSLSADSTKTQVPMGCGVADTEFLGELLLLPGTEPVGQYGSFGAAAGGNGDFNVPSACHCQALCLSLIEQGCRSYKYDSATTTGSNPARTGHCYLQSNIFNTQGTRFWEPGALGVGASSIYTSATPALRTVNSGKLSSSPFLLGFTTSPAPADGVTFSITLRGVGLPYSSSKAEDTSEFQRIKVLAASQQCHEAVPQEVVGIGCAKSTRKVATVSGTREQSVYTICSPRPAETAAETATWTDVTITASDEDTEYKVCYCAGNCFNPSQWEAVPGTFRVSQATFTWATTPAAVYRKSAGQAGSLQVDVTRPAFGSFSSADEWELKLIREYFDCTKIMDDTKFRCDTTTAGPDSTDTTGPVVDTHVVNVSGTAYKTSLSAYHTIVFDEAVTNDGCNGVWTVNASDAARTAHTITTVPCADARVIGNVAMIAATGVDGGRTIISWNESVIFDKHENAIEPATFEFEGTDASAGPPSLIYSEPQLADGSQWSTDTVTLVFSEPITLAKNVTITDCGTDFVCGTADDMVEDGFSSTIDGQTATYSGIGFLQGHYYEILVPADVMTGATSSTTLADPVTIPFVYGCPFASVVSGADTARWAYSLDMRSTDVGKFQVCFREGDGQYKAIPAADGRKYIDILPLDADTTPTRGVFHNQRFSGLAGASFVDSVNVSGTRLSVPSDSKILFTSGSCAEPGSFAFPGTFVRDSSADTTAPLLEVAATAAAASAAATIEAVRPTVLKLEYNERVTNDKCTGNFTLTARGSGEVVQVQCNSTDVFVHGSDVYVSLETGLPVAACYDLKVPTGAVADMAGNVATESNTGAVGTDTCIQVSAAASSDDVALEILFSDPMPSGQFTNASGDDSLHFHFSEPVAGKAGVFLELVDCGSDFACSSDDVMLYRFEASGLTGATTADRDRTTIKLPLKSATTNTSILGDVYKRYKLTIPANAFEDTDATPNNLNTEIVLEFVNDLSGFDYSAVLSTDTTASDSNALNVPFQMEALESGGQYSVCFCNAQDDLSREDRGDGETTFLLSDEQKVSGSKLLNSSEVSQTVGGMALGEHECHSKCSAGCTGPHCYCDGYTGASRTEATLYCLPVALCHDACHAEENCKGFNVHDTLPQCLLAKATVAEDFAADEEWQFFSKKDGTACTQAHDFSLDIGKFTVTTRVDVAVDYILEPDTPASIEVTAPAGSSLTYESSKFLSSADRITVIDYYGTCGLSNPSSSVTMPADATNIATWTASFTAASYFQDPPAPLNAPENTVDEVKIEPRSVWNSRMPGQYCPGHNMDVNDPANKASINGVDSSIKQHQCYSKCAVHAPCVGDECFCDGYYSGYDQDSSNSICGDQALCQYLCDQLGDDCQSIDMHNTLNRCFLNRPVQTVDPATGEAGPPGCSLHSDDLATDESYTLFIKANDPNDEQNNVRRLAPERSLGAPSDFSWSSQLRFGPIQIDSGGTFKVCFCDSTLAAAGVCSSVADFSVEVGTIHSSGISCLLREESLQRVSCVPQTLVDGSPGGLRCYDAYDAPQSAPEVLTHDYRTPYSEAIQEAEEARQSMLAAMEDERP